jgi:TusA-related sulfurtransferase
MASSVLADRALDVTSDTCPMTYVRTRLALERMRPGEVLAVRLRGPDASRNVPRSARRHGHDVLSQEDQADGTVLLLLRRG